MSEMLAQSPVDELAEKTPIPLTAVRKRFGVHPSTIDRWALKGCRAGDETVKLAVFWVGGRRHTTEEDLRDFLESIASGKAAERQSGAGQRSNLPTVRRRRAEQVEHKLDALGV